MVKNLLETVSKVSIVAAADFVVVATAVVGSVVTVVVMVVIEAKLVAEQLAILAFVDHLKDYYYQLAIAD